jgi:predicted lipoprotein with Yx(FWY)xxD motif
MSPRNLISVAVIVVAGLAAGCSSAATSAPASQAPASQAPASQPAASSAAPAASSAAPAASSAAPSASSSAPASGPVIKTASVGSLGTVIVASSNSMTLYTFSKDVKDSGKSVCTGGCATTWPPLTVATGTTPTGDTGVSGKIATITRDDGTVQVTYNGLPLYFFSGDKAAGDSNGVYTNWAAVKP